jgi:hypothetical protein
MTTQRTQIRIRLISSFALAGEGARAPIENFASFAGEGARAPIENFASFAGEGARAPIENFASFAVKSSLAIQTTPVRNQ